MGKSEISSGDFKTALNRFDDIIKVDPSDPVAQQAAREAARVSFFETKEFLRSIQYNQHLVFYSPSSDEVIQAQRQIVLISLEHLNDYERSIIEIGKLLTIETDPATQVELRMKLARCYYHLKRFFQALAEINESLKTPEGKAKEFHLLLLKANVLIADQKFSDAVSLLKELMEKNRTLAFKENVPITLAVCFEEMKEFNLALELLETIRPEYPIPEYVDLRIKRLKNRAKNQPKTKLKPSVAKKAEKK